MFIVSIHNSRLGRMIQTESPSEGVEEIIRLSEEKLGRKLTDEEKEGVEDTFEFYDESDSDNVWSYALGDVDTEDFTPEQ